MKYKVTIGAAIVAALALSACGGGGGGGSTSSDTTTPTVSTTAEGMWGGTTSDGRQIQAAVLPDGTIWALYTSVSNQYKIAGTYQGTGTSKNGSFAVTNGIDFNVEGNGILETVISASYSEKNSFNGSISYTAKNQSVTFAKKYMANYETPPTQGALTGLYSGTYANKYGEAMASLAIDSIGNLSGTVGSNLNCKISGTVLPKSKGVADVKIEYGPAPCANPNSVMKGIAFSGDIGNKTSPSRYARLYVMALNQMKSDGLILVIVKN